MSCSYDNAQEVKINIFFLKMSQWFQIKVGFRLSCVIFLQLLAWHRVSTNQYSSNVFLNGEYLSSASSLTPHITRNPFLDHAIISRQAAPFTGPTYLPPKDVLKCTNTQQCVRKENCQSGLYYDVGSVLPKNQACSKETDICCSLIAPPTIANNTEKNYLGCGRDSGCVHTSSCQNGEITDLSYMKTQTMDRCYPPKVCCRLPSTTLTQDGYLVKVPNKVFSLPTSPTTTEDFYKFHTQPTQPMSYHSQVPQSSEFQASQTMQTQQRLVTLKPQKYQPLQPVLEKKPQQSTQSLSPQQHLEPMKSQHPDYPTGPNNEYLPPETKVNQMKPQLEPNSSFHQQQSQQQPSQTTYRLEPQTHKNANGLKIQQRPSSQPQQPRRTQPQLSQRPTNTFISPSQQRQTQQQLMTTPHHPYKNDYRPQLQQYLPPITDNRIPDEIDRIPASSNVKPQRGEDQLSPAIYPSLDTSKFPKSFAKCASALVCTAENYCNAIGVISDSPVNLTPKEGAFRVPLTDCIIPESGAEGKCCRDSNYVDPWPVNLAGVCASRNKNTKPTGIKDFDANFAEIPWQTMILKDSTKTLLCGGAIIGDEFVLTAASCVAGQLASDLRIKAGEWELGGTNEPLRFQLISAKSFDLHPEYNPSTGSNDMAIIRLQKRLEFASHIQPICISDADPNPNEQCITTGWGRQALQIHEEGAIMHVTSTRSVSRSDCNADTTSVCSAPKFDACEFDVGSALACGIGSSMRLKGIYAAENDCGEGQAVRFSKPDVKWINTAFADRNRPLLKRRV